MPEQRTCFKAESTQTGLCEIPDPTDSSLESQGIPGTPSNPLLESLKVSQDIMGAHNDYGFTFVKQHLEVPRFTGNPTILPFVYLR